jgi:hypothetical protein
MKNKNKWVGNLALYQALIDTHPEIDLKGKTSPYTSINGHMFSILGKEGNLGLRLPKEAREQFLKDHNTVLHGAYGKVMKEYVRVPNALLIDTEALKSYLAISYTYTKGLKPKPTKRK